MSSSIKEFLYTIHIIVSGRPKPIKLKFDTCNEDKMSILNTIPKFATVSEPGDIQIDASDWSEADIKVYFRIKNNCRTYHATTPMWEFKVINGQSSRMTVHTNPDGSLFMHPLYDDTISFGHLCRLAREVFDDNSFPDPLQHNYTLSDIHDFEEFESAVFRNLNGRDSYIPALLPRPLPHKIAYLQVAEVFYRRDDLKDFIVKAMRPTFDFKTIHLNSLPTMCQEIVYKEFINHIKEETRKYFKLFEYKTNKWMQALSFMISEGNHLGQQFWMSSEKRRSQICSDLGVGARSAKRLIKFDTCEELMTNLEKRYLKGQKYDPEVMDEYHRLVAKNRGLRLVDKAARDEAYYRDADLRGDELDAGAASIDQQIWNDAVKNITRRRQKMAKNAELKAMGY